MRKYRRLKIHVTGKEEIERLVLILNIGFMTAIIEEAISAEESQFRFYSPYTVEHLKKRKVDKEIIDLHLKALELEDIKDIASKEEYFKVAKNIKLKSLEMLTKFSAEKGLGYQHWVQKDRIRKNLHIKVNREKRQVVINGNKIGGCIIDLCCPVCGQKKVYYDKYDEEFCPMCNQWDKPVCGDEECPYCKERPEKPLK